jgi:hypothetical protein
MIGFNPVSCLSEWGQITSLPGDKAYGKISSAPQHPMNKNSSSQSGFFSRRVLIGLLFCLTGVFVALAGFEQNQNSKQKITKGAKVHSSSFSSWPSVKPLPGLHYDAAIGQFVPDSPDVTPTPTPTPAMTFTVTNTNLSGPGSLRQAILDANNSPGTDRIEFNIPSNDPGCDPSTHVCTITPTAAFPLPAITDRVTIDGYSQPGASVNTLANGDNAVLLIEIDGSDHTSSIALLLQGAAAGASVIRGLVIDNGWGRGILTQTDSVAIEGCFIGIDPSGFFARANDIGVFADSFSPTSGMRIGGTTPDLRNVISGNNRGIFFQSGSNHVVQGNLIGTNRNGTAAIANAIGISVQSSDDLLIGGTTAQARNIIAGAGTGQGIFMGVAARTRIQGNFIGTDVTGTSALGFALEAVHLDSSASDTQIGGLTAMPGMPPGNVISGSGTGIQVGVGVNNVNNTAIQGNLIGTDASGTNALGNSTGVAIVDPSNTVGGTDPMARNVIAFNTNRGVDIRGGAGGEKILGNSIFANGGLGIDLIGGTEINGVTMNDNCDTDTGPNHLQNFPVITSASFSGGMVRISGTLNSVPNTMFRLEFFSSAQGDPSGNGEGQTFLGSANRATNGSCNANFGPLSFPVPPGQQVVTATATRLDAMGNPIETSEFSAFLAGPPPSPTPTPTPTATPTRSRLRNISTRSFVQTGDNVMIGGFIVHGPSPKRVIIRAIGPELTQFGVPNVLADPTLELHNGTGALIARNDNWQHTVIGGIVTHDQVQEIRQSGLAPGDFRESAIIAELPAGNYTAIVRGINVTVGVALVEVYDLALEAPPILFNISTRSFVQTGDNVMIGGFIVHGTGPKRVIIRAIGPELSQFRVPDPLQNPTLELHNGPGALIGSNDNWRTTIIGGVITHDQVQEIRNSGLAPGDGRESAIIAELPPGNYTAIVRGVNSTTGVALVEVYDLD